MTALFQLSAISYQLSAISYQLPGFSLNIIDWAELGL